MANAGPHAAERPEILDAGFTESKVGRLSEKEFLQVKAFERLLPFSLPAVILCWMTYLILVPVLWVKYGPAMLVFVPTLGAFLFAWLGHYRHELWHQYFPKLNNLLWFNFVSYLLFTDPQVYQSVHHTHHKYVHTPEDVEFFCQDWRTNRKRRKRQFILEFLFGNMAWELSTFMRLRAEGRAGLTASVIALGKRLAIFLALLTMTLWLEPAALWSYVWTYVLTIWAGAVLTRHNQWVEHLGIVSNGSLAERNLLARNLPSTTVLGRLFNILNQNDAREHIFHHTEPKLNSRGVDLALPAGGCTVTLPQYLQILADYYRQL
jgi:hypothetical protein